MAGKKFNPTIIEEGFGAVAIAAGIVSSPLLHSWYCKWGATPSELNMSLPGDDLVPQPKLETTRAISIQAPADEIWPWLVQMGQGRGGLYSYERLENLIGWNMHNADRILPEHQDLKIGDKVRFVLRGDIPGGQTTPTTWIWLFFRDPIDEKNSRLINRSRLVYEPSLGNTLMWRVFTDPISFVMERKMLQGIKVRAEAAAAN